MDRPDRRRFCPAYHGKKRDWPAAGGVLSHTEKSKRGITVFHTGGWEAVKGEESGTKRGG